MLQLVIPLAPMGVLAPGSAHARPSAQPPIDTSEKFQHTCLGGGSKKIEKISDQFFQKTPLKNRPPGGDFYLFF